MSKVRVNGFSISLDGFAAGPDQSLKHPLGVRGPELFEWFMATRSWKEMQKLEGGSTGEDDAWAHKAMENVGAWIMGRNMFGPIRGEWGDRDWKGWWGDDPPYHALTYVLTHHAHDPIEMEGGTTFHFVTDGLKSAFAQAREAAGDKKVSIAGGASCAQQALAAGLVDEVDLQVSPVILGAGERLLDNFEPGSAPELELERVLEAPGVAHLRYRVT